MSHYLLDICLMICLECTAVCARCCKIRRWFYAREGFLLVLQCCSAKNMCTKFWVWPSARNCLHTSMFICLSFSRVAIFLCTRIVEYSWILLLWTSPHRNIVICEDLAVHFHHETASPMLMCLEGLNLHTCIHASPTAMATYTHRRRYGHHLPTLQPHTDAPNIILYIIAVFF